MLRNIDQNIWVAEQPLRYFGLSIGTRMTVIRFTNGELAVKNQFKSYCDGTLKELLWLMVALWSMMRRSSLRKATSCF